jgi:hypothetical protein
MEEQECFLGITNPSQIILFGFVLNKVGYFFYRDSMGQPNQARAWFTG